jgi:hypothetical protein
MRKHAKLPGEGRYIGKEINVADLPTAQDAVKASVGFPPARQLPARPKRAMLEKKRAFERICDGGR